ncbi:ORF46 [Lymantria xylina nucleopolyhedrovirus]|uniref:ORF46 n=1 Tax=Lymantria xylina multiple nucleopolyhedrovirus TaxID=2847840 RepID=D4N283_9ABAC|nr:ORF46 [Lymantria xylina nucleopolyhedrovirus]ADD73755.1 ORF46 [Lymantria xylina nucleopolyhedrovirus]
MRANRWIKNLSIRLISVLASRLVCMRANRRIKNLFKFILRAVLASRLDLR